MKRLTDTFKSHFYENFIPWPSHNDLLPVSLCYDRLHRVWGGQLTDSQPYFSSWFTTKIICVFGLLNSVFPINKKENGVNKLDDSARV